MAPSNNLQLRILREFAGPRTFSSPRPTYSEVAKKLGIDEETVRVRVRRAQRAGLILGWVLSINPHVLGREATNVVLTVGDPSLKQTMISQIKLIDEVIMIMDFYENPLRVTFCHENDRDKERRLALIKSICGDQAPIYWQAGVDPSRFKLKRTDWQILKSLLRDSLQSNGEIARELKVSSRTVRRRLSLMMEEKAISLHTFNDVKRVPGIPYFFLVKFSDDKKKREADEKVVEKLENGIYFDTRDTQFSTYAAVFHNLGEADETQRWIKNLKSVENARMFVMKDIIPILDFYDKEVGRHLYNERMEN